MTDHTERLDPTPIGQSATDLDYARGWSDAIKWANQERITPLQEQVKEYESRQIWLFNQGYTSGHHDTVESMYTDIHYEDMDTYHDDVVSDLLAERIKAMGDKND